MIGKTPLLHHFSGYIRGYLSHFSSQLGDNKTKHCWALVAHACNPRSSGGRNQEDRGSKPAQANSSRDPILKKIHHKKGLAEWLKVWALSSNCSTTKQNTHTDITLPQL
jgi:hypothetical protein